MTDLSYIKCAHSWFRKENPEHRAGSRRPFTCLSSQELSWSALWWESHYCCEIDDGKVKGWGNENWGSRDLYRVGVLLNQSLDDGILAAAFWCHLTINDNNDKYGKTYVAHACSRTSAFLTRNSFDLIRSNAIQLICLHKDWWSLHKDALSREGFTSFVSIPGSGCSINNSIKQYGRCKSANKVTWGVTVRAFAED